MQPTARIIALRLLGVAVLLILAATACSAQVRVVEAEPTDSVDGVESPSRSDEADPVDGSNEPLDASAAPSPAKVFDQVADSIVLLQGTESSGTGIVIEDGWILTNAHVVERMPEVLVRRFDGAELGTYEVFGVDWIFDVALVGPLSAGDLDLIDPMTRESSAGVAVGDEVMLVGFPDESNLVATPTLTTGVVSRRRYTAVGDFGFLQVDATIAPGQSGGALVDSDGDLIGMSGLEFGDGEFGLAFEADSLWPRVDRLIEIGPRPQLSVGEPVFEMTDELGSQRTLGFVVEVEGRGDVELLVEGDADLYIDVLGPEGFSYVEYPPLVDPFAQPFDLGGESFFIDELLDGGEELAAELPPGLWEVIIGSFSETLLPVQVSSVNALHPFADIEEGAALPVGELVEGEIDWSGDSDRWSLDLKAGDKVSIIADGIADAILAVRLDGEVLAGSDDEYLGLLGTASSVYFVAPESASYEVEIGSYDQNRWGYLVEVQVE